MSIMNLGDEELEYGFGNCSQRAGGRCEPVQPDGGNGSLELGARALCRMRKEDPCRRYPDRPRLFPVNGTKGFTGFPMHESDGERTSASNRRRKRGMDAG